MSRIAVVRPLNAGVCLALAAPRDPYKDGKLGVVQAGAYADMILVEGNPLENIDLVANPQKNFQTRQQTGRLGHMGLNRCHRGLLTIMLLLAGVTSAGAAESSDENNWKFGAQIYIWGAGIGATTRTGGDIDVTFSDILRDLDMTLMGNVTARKGKWLLAADVIYLNVSQDNVSSIPFTNADIKGWVVTPVVGYNLINTDKGTLDAVAGVRYLHLNASLDVLGFTVLSDSSTIWNGVVGARGQVNLAPNWFLPYYADIGAGQSKLTWQAFAGIGYKFKHVDAILGYRYLDWKFKDDNKVFDDLNFSGPIAGVRFQF